VKHYDKWLAIVVSQAHVVNQPVPGSVVLPMVWLVSVPSPRPVVHRFHQVSAILDCTDMHYYHLWFDHPMVEAVIRQTTILHCIVRELHNTFWLG
jgi:hypothetical protein